jgi:hypothetical protein
MGMPGGPPFLKPERAYHHRASRKNPWCIGPEWPRAAGEKISFYFLSMVFEMRAVRLWPSNLW